ncbi:MAG: hypothetical protein ACOYNR_06495 [Blastocatellia bacterium]
MERLIEFLFKYRWSTFARGELGLAYRPAWWVMLLLLIGGGGLLAYLYWRPARVGGRQGEEEAGRTVRWLLIGLRASLLTVLVILLMRPILVLPAIIPQSTSLLVLVDDSLSMGLPEAGREGRPEPRIEGVKRLLGADQPLRKALGEKFQVRQYAFSGSVRPLTSVGELRADGTATDLAGALEEGVREVAGAPLSAIVLATDGGSNTARDLGEVLQRLRGRQLPVFPIGVGATEQEKDQELVRVEVPRRVLIGSAVSAEVVVRLAPTGLFGKAGRSVLTVKEDGRLVRTEPLPPAGEDGVPQRMTVEFSPTSAGLHRYLFEISPVEGESSPNNNLRETLIEIVEESPRILHLEGEPRWEYGKLRASLARKERQLRLVSVLRSAEGKYYRQGVTSGEELTEGFPKTDEELFGYAGLVIGSLEANFFRYEQLRWIEQFAARRGGGILLLGGGRAFGAGGYGGTPIEELLPLTLTSSGGEKEQGSPMGFRAVLTGAGRLHPVTRLNEDRAVSAKVWESLPPLTLPEILRQPKPAATTILEAVDIKNQERTAPLLVEQRYGRGRTLALLANDTWRWRMEMPSESTAHETFWRQLLRYLVSTTPRQFEVGTEEMVYAIGDRAQLRAEVLTPRYEPMTDATVRAVVTSPSGKRTELPLALNDAEQTSDYQTTLTLTEAGIHQVEMVAQRGGAPLGEARGAFLVTEQTREYFETAQNVELLKRIARETGGRYTPLAEASTLAEELSMLEGAHSERVRRDLWDMPFNFLLLIGLAGAEWGLRKRRGLS